MGLLYEKWGRLAQQPLRFGQAPPLLVQQAHVVDDDRAMPLGVGQRGTQLQ